MYMMELLRQYVLKFQHNILCKFDPGMECSNANFRLCLFERNIPLHFLLIVTKQKFFHVFQSKNTGACVLNSLGVKSHNKLHDQKLAKNCRPFDLYLTIKSVTKDNIIGDRSPKFNCIFTVKFLVYGTRLILILFDKRTGTWVGDLLKNGCLILLLF